jgi:hypothetical protein
VNTKKAAEILKRGLDAYARIQESLKRITWVLKTIELPKDADSYQIEMIRSGKEEIARAHVDTTLDADAMREALLQLDEILRSVAAAYEAVYQLLPQAYQEGEQAGLTRFYVELDEDSLHALKLAANVLADLSDTERATLCERLRSALL